MPANRKVTFDRRALKVALARTGRTQRSIAIALEMSETDLSARIAGARPVTLALVEQIAKHLGVEPTTLIAGSVDRTPIQSARHVG